MKKYLFTLLALLFLSAHAQAQSIYVGRTTADNISSASKCLDAGANDTYACSLTPAPSSYVTGTRACFFANTANTGAATINFNGLGAKTIKKPAGGITTDLATNDIQAGQWVCVVYDGTNMQMISQLGNAGGGGTTLEGVHVTHTADQAISDNTETTLTWDTENFDNGALHSGGSPTRLTAATTGYYIITANVVWSGSSTSGARSTFLRLNGTSFISASGYTALSAGNPYQSVSTVYKLTAADYVEVRVLQNSGGSLNVLTSTATNFGMQMISQ